MKRVLVAIPCDYDPQTIGQGPILGALKREHYDEIALLELNPWSLNVLSTQQCLQEQFPKLGLNKYCLDIQHICSYAETWDRLRALQDLLATHYPPHTYTCEILLPPACYPCLLDCYLLRILSWSIPYRLVHLELPLAPLPTPSATMALNDYAVDPHRAPLSQKQLAYLYRLLYQETAFQLSVASDQEQSALNGAITTHLNAQNQIAQSIRCPDIPQSLSDSLLFGYNAPGGIHRNGLLAPKNASHLSLVGFHAFPSNTQSTVVSYLSRTQRRFVLLSTHPNPALPIKTFQWPALKPCNSH